MKTPEGKRIVLTFLSHPMKDAKARWCVRLVFEGGSVASSDLTLNVEDGEGTPVKEGLFEFAGKALPVKDGLATIKYRDFIVGKSKPGVWLHRRGVVPVPGGLTFV